MPIAPILFLLIAGFLAGLLGSLLGLGGGILIIPVLVLLLKTPMHNAVATSLLCVIATSSATASRNVTRGIANVRLGMSLEVATVIGAMIGSSLAGVLSETSLMVTFACAMLVMSIPMARRASTETVVHHDGGAGDTRSLFMRELDGTYFDEASGQQVSYSVRRYPVALSISSVAGVLSGLLGVGGGIIKVPALTLLCGIPMKAAAATSNFVIGVTAVASAVIFYGRGDVLPIISAASVLGVFAGSRLGVRLAARVRSRALRLSFAAVMVIVALQFFYKAHSLGAS